MGSFSWTVYTKAKYPFPAARWKRSHTLSPCFEGGHPLELGQFDTVAMLCEGGKLTDSRYLLICLGCIQVCEWAMS